MRVLNAIEHADLLLEDEDNTLHDILISQLKSSKETQTLKGLCLMGMEYDFRKDNFLMSYYVGADWIDEKRETSLVVRPKIVGLDFQTMLMKCFSCVNTSLDNLFYIRTEDKPIKISSKDFQLEPLLIVYYLNIVSQIVRKGLRQDYIQREEQLNGKIKGKVLFARYAKHGYAQNRKDLVNCRYQEYSIDCLDNRILKKALLYCHDMIKRNARELGLHLQSLDNMYKDCMAAFDKATADVTLQDLERVHVNPMYKKYREALPLAKMIIRKQGYCVGRKDYTKEQMFPPFIINMPILFEQYVHALLVDRYGNYNIGYQVGTTGNIMDFCKYDEHLIMDTKYILKWNEGTDHENIRQLSGYARNRRLRYKLGVKDDTCICPCLIIYPSANGVENIKDFDDELYRSDGLLTIYEYVKFKKLPIKLPLLN